MGEQTDKIERFEEIDEDRDTYPIEEKLFNMTASKVSECSRKFSGGDF